MAEKLTFLVGFMGCGKTYTGRRMAARLHVDFVDLDAHIEAVAGMSITEIFAERGEPGFRELERECLHGLAQLAQPTVVATGGGAPCFFDNMAWMNAHGHTIFLDVSLDVLVERLWQGRAHRPILANIPEDDFERTIAERLATRRPWYEQAKEVWR
jgi:shikimate kinase